MRKWVAVILPLLWAGIARGAAVPPTTINGAPGHVWWQAAINDTVSPPTQANIRTAPFSAESTAVLSVSGLKSCALRIQVWAAAGDTGAVSIAVAVKALTSNAPDTLTSSTWQRWNNLPAAASPDSIGRSGLPLTDARWGEFKDNFDSRAWVPSAFRDWSPGNAHFFELWGPRSEPFSAPFMQVRVRCLGPLGGGKPRIRVDVVGEKK